MHCIQRCPRFMGLENRGSTVYRGVLVLGSWNIGLAHRGVLILGSWNIGLAHRGVLILGGWNIVGALYTEVSLF